MEFFSLGSSLLRLKRSLWSNCCTDLKMNLNAVRRTVDVRRKEGSSGLWAEKTTNLPYPAIPAPLSGAAVVIISS